MARIRGEEEWALRCIRAALGGVQVVHHDDGSKPGMHDLDIVYTDRPPGAVEVTAAADADSIELWNLINGDGRWIEPDLAGGWGVALLPQARARRLRAELPRLLRPLEEAGIRELHGGPWHHQPFEDAAFDLRVTHLWQGGTDYPGSIYPTIDLPSEKSGGVVQGAGDPLAAWLGGWISQPEQTHNLEKLVRSGADERHLFVILPGFSDPPFAVADLLMRDDPPLPSIAPVLPPEVTHVWAMSTWDTKSGMRWAAKSGWQYFDKQTTPEPKGQ